MDRIARAEQLQLSPKGEHNSAEQEQERDTMIPLDAFIQIRPCEDDKHAERDCLLDDFQLKCCKFTIAEAIRGDLKTVFGERNQPAHDDYDEKRGLAVLQVTVPCNCHEDVGTNKK
jgi:hypothetical protein